MSSGNPAEKAFVIITSNDTVVHSDDYDEWINTNQDEQEVEVFRASEGTEIYERLTLGTSANHQEPQ